jgi:hypothetical protein
MIDYQPTNIGSTEHYSTATLEQYRDLSATTLCGRRLAGTPSSPTTTDFCQECQALLPCDECEHPGTSHVWAPAAEERSYVAGQFVYQHATCWAENICRDCNATSHAQVLALLAEGVPAMSLEQVPAFLAAAGLPLNAAEAVAL